MAQNNEGDDYEEVILMVELTGLPNPDMITQCQGTCTILGIDTPEPMMQVDNYVFKGRYADTLGTAMIFKQDGGKKKLSYVCKTNRKLEMSRVLLRKTNNHKQQQQQQQQSSRTHTLTVTKQQDTQAEQTSTSLSK